MATFIHPARWHNGLSTWDSQMLDQQNSKKKKKEAAAERVCRLGQSPSKGLFFTSLKTRLPPEPSVLFFMLIFSQVTHFITPKCCWVVRSFTFSPRQIIIRVMKCPSLRNDASLLFMLCLYRVEEAYRRISGPACVTVDASPSADQVLRQVQLLIRGKCHL